MEAFRQSSIKRARDAFDDCKAEIPRQQFPRSILARILVHDILLRTRADN